MVIGWGRYGNNVNITGGYFINIICKNQAPLWSDL
jgi:hypothetical protein